MRWTLKFHPGLEGPPVLELGSWSAVFGFILMRHTCVCVGGVLLWVTLDVCVVHIITSLTEWICPLLFNFLFVNSMASTSNWQLKSLSLSSTRDAGRPEVVYFEKECNNGYLKKMTEVTEFLGRQAGRPHHLTEALFNRRFQRFWWQLHRLLFSW